MITVVIDTNILIDFAHKKAAWLEKILTSNKTNLRLVIPAIVISEYFASSLLEKKAEARAAEKLFSLFEKQDFNEEIAKILGRIIRRKTYPPSANLADLIIAATTICLDAKLATRNQQDFNQIPGLAFFNHNEYLQLN